MTAALFRPVGLHELALEWDKAMGEFPPRLPSQPIFYPVANITYTRQIARDWNRSDEKSGFAGFVTSFDVDKAYLSGLEPHRVGSSEHLEYWIPAGDLSGFNAAIRGLIEQTAFLNGRISSRWGWLSVCVLTAVPQNVAVLPPWFYSVPPGFAGIVSCEEYRSRFTT